MEQQDFQGLIRRVRAGEAKAAAELVRAYEPELRRYAHMRLSDPRLQPVLDSMDVCQSVLANFFVRAAAGQFDLERPEDLLKLLGVMVRNKVNDIVRRQRSGRRAWDRRAGPDGLETVASSEPAPAQIAVDRELLAEVYRRLTADERHVAQQRALGYQWEELAAQLGESAETLRKRHSRALDRVANELHLDDRRA
jgi:RNA polymerase sigma-70 factor (ECF subfamily)